MGSLLPKGNKAPGERITSTLHCLTRWWWGEGVAEVDGKETGEDNHKGKKGHLLRPSHTISVISVYDIRP